MGLILWGGGGISWVGGSVALLLLACLAGGALGAEDVAFAGLDPATVNQVVLMYRSGEALSDAGLAVLEGAEAAVRASGAAGSEAITFRKCDASHGDNGAGMAAKGIETFPMIFVSIEGQGMDRYVREMEAGKLSAFILTKLEPSTDEDVFPYSEDLISDEYPVFVKFFESWCSRCLAMKKAFENAASRMVGRVMFMEVECSATDEAMAFCHKHGVDGYPTLKLMGGSIEKPIEYDRDRSVEGFMEFLNQNVPEEEEAAEGEGGAVKEEL